MFELGEKSATPCNSVGNASLCGTWESGAVDGGPVDTRLAHMVISQTMSILPPCDGGTASHAHLPAAIPGRCDVRRRTDLGGLHRALMTFVRQTKSPAAVRAELKKGTHGWRK